MKDILIIVPYRNRENDLKKFYEIVPYFYKKRNISFDIVICELSQKGDWNAGLCINSIMYYLENVSKQYKYVYIHHVDVYPEAGDFIFPNSKECIFNLGDYGSCILSLDDFLTCKGFLNSFWGWGSEDNHFYSKVFKNNIKLINFDTISDKTLIFNIDNQNHERKFDSKNYANNANLLYSQQYDEKDNIDNFYDYGEIDSYQQKNDNIHVIKVTSKNNSPSLHKNNKAVFLYIEDQKKFEYVSTVIKSALLQSSYNYDIVTFLGDISDKENIATECLSFGCKVVHHKKIVLFNGSSSIERHYAYKKFLEQDTQYDEILHVDAADALFFKNPFDFVDNTKITVTHENVLHEHESWNFNMLKNIYSDYNILNFIAKENVICAGLIYGPKNLFLKLTTHVIDEYEKLQPKNKEFYGVDQPIFNKLVYINKILSNDELTIKSTFDNFCIHLHTPLNNVNYSGKKISIPLNLEELSSYALIHQYNRCNETNKHISQFFTNYFKPIVVDK